MNTSRLKCVALLAVSLLVYAEDAPNSVMLPAGTRVIVRATEAVTPRKVKSGDKLPFVVHEDVVVNKQVVIKAETPAEVIVTDAQRSSSWSNRQGRLDFEILAVEAVDGTRVELRNYKDYAQVGETQTWGHAYYSNPKIANDQTFLAAVKSDTAVRVTPASEKK